MHLSLWHQRRQAPGCHKPGRDEAGGASAVWCGGGADGDGSDRQVEYLIQHFRKCILTRNLSHAAPSWREGPPLLLGPSRCPRPLATVSVTMCLLGEGLIRWRSSEGKGPRFSQRPGLAPAVSGVGLPGGEERTLRQKPEHPQSEAVGSLPQVGPRVGRTLVFEPPVESAPKAGEGLGFLLLCEDHLTPHHA